MPDQAAEFLLSFAETGHVAVAQWTVQPGGGVPLHTHEHEHETWIVTQGTFRFEVGSEEYVVGPGAIVFGPQGVPHSFFNVGDGEGKFYLLLSSDNFEAFIAEWCANGPSEAAMAAHGLKMMVAEVSA